MTQLLLNLSVRVSQLHDEVTAPPLAPSLRLESGMNYRGPPRVEKEGNPATAHVDQTPSTLKIFIFNVF